MSDIVKNRLELAKAMKKGSDIKLESIDSFEKLEIPGDTAGVSSKVFDLGADDILEFGSLNGYGNYDATVCADEIIAYVQKLRTDFNQNYASEFFDQQRDTVLNTITDRFMLGGIMARRDIDGGNVDTVHNAREGVYATQEAVTAYENRGEYNSTEYHSHPNYVNKNRETSAALKEGTLNDSYTGKTMAPNASKDLDHTIAAKEIHDDAGRVLAGLNGTDLANADKNLNPTDASINRSKKQKSVDQFTAEITATAESRENKIAELRSRGNLSDAERKELNKLEKLDSVDAERMKKIDKEARKDYEKKVNKAYYCSPKFIKTAGLESAKQGAQMGTRQIIGVFMCEAIGSVFDEIRDFCKNGMAKGKNWWQDLKVRISRILENVRNKWQEALSAGFQGAISGFFSNILTVIINAFVKTATNLVRIIREGFFSIVKAIKMLLNPPEGMTQREVYHEVGKLIIAGVVIIVGILLEETIDTLPPMKAIRAIPVFGEVLADVVFGFMTALAAALALWGWDKIDLFNVKEEKRHAWVMDILEQDREKILKERASRLERIRVSDPVRYDSLLVEIGF